MSVYLGTSPIFDIVGFKGSCQLFTDKLGYVLYFEDYGSNAKPEAVREYACRVNAVADAFNDAKQFCGLEDWNMDWFSFHINSTVIDGNKADEWNDLINHIGKVLGDE